MYYIRRSVVFNKTYYSFKSVMYFYFVMDLKKLLFNTKFIMHKKCKIAQNFMNRVIQFLVYLCLKKKSIFSIFKSLKY